MAAAVSLENFDAEIGRRVARENARAKIWQLEGYRLKCELADKAMGVEKGFYVRNLSAEEMTE